MNTQEFSAQFDVLYNNITSNQAPGLNEYEKSVFLTKAQAQLINEYFNSRTDGFGGGFDGSQKRQYDFSSIIKTEELINIPANQLNTKGIKVLDARCIAGTYGLVYQFPKDYYLSVNEMFRDGNYQYSILPLSYAEYQRLMQKPYSFPVKRSVWRLITQKLGIDENNDEEIDYYVPIVEIIGKFSGTDSKVYTIRYVKKPAPIILEDLSGYGVDITIDGTYDKTECELPEETHEEILERAVTLAKIAWQGGTMTQAAAQQRNND